MGGPDKTGIAPAAVFVLSAASSGVSETITFPADVVKTRLQAQTELGASKRGIARTFVGIVKEEGIGRLYGGLFPACLRHVVYSGSRMMIYEYLREDVLGRDAHGNFALWKGVVAGLSAGALGQFIANPTDLAKVQMQMDGKRISQGQKPLYTSTAHAFKTLYKQNGIRGMWRGWVPNCQRAGLTQLGDLTSYDFFKQKALAHGFKDGPTTHAMASGGAGLVAAFFGTPADVIKTRIMNQPLDANGKGLQYSGTMDCLRQAVRHEGVLALYKGFVPAWLRMAPWSLVYFLTFEQLRAAAGLKSF
eukprot:m.1263465 g.1263465  ORF g.1263465 m.1263465 type:complete len:304 (-) comp24734_c1_seq10:3281-4192(-)